MFYNGGGLDMLNYAWPHQKKKKKKSSPYELTMNRACSLRCLFFCFLLLSDHVLRYTEQCLGGFAA